MNKKTQKRCLTEPDTDGWSARHVGIRSNMMRDYWPRKCIKGKCAKQFTSFLQCNLDIDRKKPCVKRYDQSLGQNFPRYDMDRKITKATLM